MPEILIQTKITTPFLNSKIVHRERLSSLLDENIDKNLVIIFAPAGFGKTTLVLDYLHNSRHKHVWLSIPQKGIADASTFFEYLINAFANLEKDFGAGILEVMKQFTQSPKMVKELVSGCTASFINEFRKHFTENITLVIDDLQFMDSDKSLQWLKEFFDEMYENIPPNLHLLLVTRVMPELNMTKLKAKRNVFMITEKELTFDKDEISELLGSVYGYDYCKEDLNLLEDNLKGWITGIHLILQAYGEDFRNVKFSGDIGYTCIFDFFAQEVFDSLSTELQEFLLVTSLIENFDERISNSVLKIKNSKEMLDELTRKNLFIQQSCSEGNNGYIKYSYHSLFRNFLNQRIKKSGSNCGIKKIKEEIAENYLQSGDEVTAVNYFLEAENFESAIPLVKKNTKNLYDTGKYHIIKRWYGLIPEDKLNSDGELLYFKGYLSCYIDAEYGLSLHCIGKAEEHFKRNNDEDGLVKCCKARTWVYILTGKVCDAKKEMENILKNGLKPNNIIDIYTQLSHVYCRLTLYKDAIEILERALKICENNNIRKIHVYEALGSTFLEMGDYEKAKFFFQKAPDENIRTNFSGIISAYTSLGNYSDSIKYFNNALKILSSSFSRHDYIKTLNQKALLLKAIGDFSESIKTLEHIYPLAEKYNIISQLCYITANLFDNYYFLNDHINCDKYLRLFKIYTEENNLDFYKKEFELRNAIYLMKYNSKSNVKMTLQCLYDYFDKLNDDEFRRDVLIQLSNYYLLTCDTNSALDILAKFFNKYSFEANDLVNHRNIIDFALSNPKLDKYKDNIYSAFTEFFDRLNIEGTSEDYKKKMKVQIENLYDLKMNSFGGLQIILRGNHVAESNWKKKKGKSMLAYMMTDLKAKYSKDKLIEMFFPDAKPETAEDIFRQAIFCIRSAVKLPYLNILLHEGNTYFLNPDCYFKSDVSEFNKYCGRIRSNNSTKEEKIQACKDAIELYKSDFMEGVYETWCEEIRQEYLNKFISISETLLNLLDTEKDYEDLIYYSEKLISHDKLNEQAYLKLIEAHMIFGKKRIARDTYDKMLKAYMAELGEKPDREILCKLENLIGNTVTYSLLYILINSTQLLDCISYSI